MRPSIAVLPFENRSRDEDDEYFSDGVTEDIISALAKVEGLRVTHPAASAFRFKGEGTAVRQVAEKLNVRLCADRHYPSRRQHGCASRSS